MVTGGSSGDGIAISSPGGGGVQRAYRLAGDLTGLWNRSKVQENQIQGLFNSVKENKTLRHVGMPEI